MQVNPKYALRGLTVRLKVDEMCRAAGAVVRRQQKTSPLVVTVGHCRGSKMRLTAGGRLPYDLQAVVIGTKGGSNSG